MPKADRAFQRRRNEADADASSRVKVKAIVPELARVAQILTAIPKEPVILPVWP